MKARPILFKPDMVNAILEGRKTMTRRVMKVQPPTERHHLLGVMSSTDRRKEGKSHWGVLDEWKTRILESDPRYFSCPYGAPGDVLWVRETFSGPWGCRRLKPTDWPKGCPIWYWADGDQADFEATGPKPSIHMPKWASRLTLEITDVRVERLQDISEDDARAEGIADGGCLNCGEPEPCGCSDPEPDARDAFIHLWRSINGEESWVANPWVWCITFQPHHMNVDAFLRDREVA